MLVRHKQMSFRGIKPFQGATERHIEVLEETLLSDESIKSGTDYFLRRVNPKIVLLGTGNDLSRLRDGVHNCSTKKPTFFINIIGDGITFAKNLIRSELKRNKTT